MLVVGLLSERKHLYLSDDMTDTEASSVRIQGGDIDLDADTIEDAHPAERHIREDRVRRWRDFLLYLIPSHFICILYFFFFFAVFLYVLALIYVELCS